MKNYILILLFFTIGMHAQTLPSPKYNNTETNTLKIKTPATVTSVNYLSTAEIDGTVSRVLPENITLNIVPPPVNYVPSEPNLQGHLKGIDTRLGQIGNTTAGITNRIYFTGVDTTISAGTFFTSSAAGKGAVAVGTPAQTVTNNDNEKKYFTKDIISIAQPSATTAPPGNYSGQLSVRIDANNANQKYTIEIYKCNNGGTPIASGITGAPTGSLGVTVVAILDSGLLNLVPGNVSNIALNGNLASTLSLNTGERLRYHVSAEKVGTDGGNIVMEVFYGSNYNSFYDVTVSQKTSTVLNDSGVTGLTASDALNNLNTTLGINSTAIAWVDVNGNNATAQIGNSRKAFLTIEAALDALPSTGGVINIGIGTFNSPDKTKIKANCFFLGSGKPFPNMTVTYTDETSAPTYSSPTKLVGGTILTGNFYIDKVDNVQVSDLGIDCGKDFIDAFRAGVTEEGLTINGVLTSANNNNTMPPIKGVRINNVSSLNYSATAPRHAVLVQDGFDITFNNISTYFGVHGIALKGRNINLNNAQCFGHDIDGLIVKSDKYSYASDVSVNNVFITSIGSYDGSGIIVESGGDVIGGTDNRLYRVNLSNINIRFTKFGIIDLGSVSKTDNINISNVNVYKVSASAIYFRANSKNISLSNINIDGVTAGNAVTLISTAADEVKTLSNCVVKNANGVGQNAYFFNAVGGKVNLVNVYSPDSSIAIDGGSTSNVRGYNVSSGTTFTGALLFDANTTTDNIPSIDANGIIKKSLATVSSLGGGVFPNGVSGKSVASTFGASDTVGSGSFFALTNGLAAGAQRQFVLQLNASNGITAHYFNGTAFVDTLFRITNAGAISFTSGIISTTPTTSAGTYDILTRNISTGVVEKILSTSLPTSGTYTPTLTNTGNTSGLSLQSATYTRVGNIVTAVVNFSLTATAVNVDSSISITLPINRGSGSPTLIGNGSLRNTASPASSHNLTVQSVNTTQCQVLFVPTVVTNPFSGSVTFQYSI